MKNEHVISSQICKHADITDEIEWTQLVLPNLVKDLDPINSAISIFGSNADIGAITFRDEMMRFVMGRFRMAKTTKEIALAVAEGRGLREDDAER